MLEVSSPVVQVVTGGTDWPAIAAAGATVVVAVAGIWGTAWQARKGREAAHQDLARSLGAAAKNLATSIQAENARAERAEKRLIYARSLARLTDVEVANAGYDPAQPELGSKDRSGKLDAALDAVGELQLIAPGKLADLAGRVMEMLATHILGESTDTITEAAGELFRKMRDDLGLPEETARKTERRSTA